MRVDVGLGKLVMPFQVKVELKALEWQGRELTVPL